MSYDTPLSSSGQQLAELPLREQLRRGFKDMGSRSFSSAKNFGLVGAMFAGTECCIEGVRCERDEPSNFVLQPLSLDDCSTALKMTSQTA